MIIEPEHTSKSVAVALLTVADGAMGDGGAAPVLAERIRGHGHALVTKASEKPDLHRVGARLNNWIDDRTIDAVIVAGGTGIGPQGVTPEAVDRVATRTLPGFGELVRRLCHPALGSAMALDGSAAVLARGTAIFTLPDNAEAAAIVWDQILADVLPHFARG
ncbi:molybdopterin binding domain-containing protein [Novosphingobium nitrogenifigens DSM 19370]|uniref:Molybdenum cofactor biosynthesis protein B n=1 Tax=Novosphingobium nitrogenifigens DSM 19370 TaxID=983920 RepID=F1ZA82_9SPHN|nr:molybdopterin-binding protein [Novosphingobium nitrogenifigens]EGD58510.1 molybdopterin binding domain-containing protein [Novosphingobium nitrogenifigens DSM 19370]